MYTFPKNNKVFQFKEISCSVFNLTLRDSDWQVTTVCFYLLVTLQNHGDITADSQVAQTAATHPSKGSGSKSS